MIDTEYTQTHTEGVLNKDALLDQLWNEKRGKLQGDNPYTLYLTIDSPQIDMARITASFIRALEADISKSLRWSQKFGKVFIGLNQSGGVECSLKLSSESARDMVAIHSSKAYPIAQYVDVMSQGTSGEIILNDVDQPPEAFLISYIHMLDEYIWELTRHYENVGVHPEEAYSQALKVYKAMGARISVAQEHDILNLAHNGGCAVRLYGSKVHAAVPYVMGGVIIEPLNKDELNGQYVDVIRLQRGEAQSAMREPLPPKSDLLHPGEVAVSVSVTFGKNLHAGHAFLLAVGDLVRTGTESNVPLALINNNTGPRPAAALQLFAQRAHIPIDQAVEILARGEISADEIVEIYTSRDDSLVQPEVIEKLDAAGVDIFSSVTLENQSAMNRAGFAVRVLSESQALVQSQEECEVLLSQDAPSWRGSGFLPFPINHKEVSIVQKGGQYTGVGKAVITQVAHLKNTSASSCVLVDSCAATRAASNILDIQLGDSGYAKQAYGAGYGIDGRIASGTKGEALTLNQLNHLMEAQGVQFPLRDVVSFMVLMHPLSCDGTHGIAESMYDFASNQAFCEALLRTAEGFGLFIGKVNETLGVLRGKVAKETQLSDKRASSHFLHSGSLLKKLSQVQKLDGSTLMGTVKKIEKPQEREVGLRMMGYHDAQLVHALQTYDGGERFLALRFNPSFEELKRCLESARYVISLSAENFEDFQKIVRICMTRLGFERYMYE